MAIICPHLFIAAPQGRSGKTTLSIGLSASLNQRGLRVQPFKKGPDYIDPSWLGTAAGRSCRTLDPFFQPSARDLKKSFRRGVEGADLAFIEGNHGLFDSAFHDGSGSSAAVARVLGSPILLVINAARMGRSVAAMVQGYQSFEPETPIAAVLLNNVAGKRHFAKLRFAIETHCGIPVVGSIPRHEAITIPDRHLGLVPQAENETLMAAIEACRIAVERFVDIEAVLNIARTRSRTSIENLDAPVHEEAHPLPGPMLGIIRDQAFTFYYPENLEALERAGARLEFISAIQDNELPQVDALYVGGGFPEMFMTELQANVSLRKAIRAEIEAGLPVYAECGGLMYLSKCIHWKGGSAEMVGALPYEVEINERPQGHGYVDAEVTAPNPFWSLGTRLRGHEFHHSHLRNFTGISSAAYRLQRGSGLGNAQDGIVYRNVLAAYTHLHVDGSPGWAEGLVACARQYAKERDDG